MFYGNRTVELKRILIYGMYTEAVKMKSVKARVVGTSTILTVPKGIQTKYQVYDVFSGHNDAIVFLPKEKNPFTDSDFIRKHQGALSDKDFINTEVQDDETLMNKF